jgi:hypothetical protein
MSYHVYLVTDPNGCWPLITNCAIPWKAMRGDLLLVYPRGSYTTLQLALVVADEIRTVAAEQEGTPLQRAARFAEC